MDLNDILDERIITIGLDAKDKEDALYQMSEQLYQQGYIDNVEEFVKDIYAREAEGVTGIGQGIAIPHGKSKSAARLGIAIATLKKPIAWETLDGEDVKAIFLFCVSNDADFERNHMVMLSRVAARLADDELIAKVITSQSSQELIHMMRAPA